MIVQGWVDWASRLDGPDGKTYPEANQIRGIALHSMEGSYAGSLAELTRPERQASWHFSLRADGSLIQHYPITASCWASGNKIANTRLVAIELEGKAGTPITTVQVVILRRVIREIGVHAGWVATRAETGRTIWQHNEVWNWGWPNAGATACPSNRYQPYFDSIEESPVTPEITLADVVRALGGAEAIRAWNTKGNALLPGYAEEQAEQGSIDFRLGKVEERIDALTAAEHAAGHYEHTHTVEVTLR